MQNYKQIPAIKVTIKTQTRKGSRWITGEIETQIISFDQFEKFFIEERWCDERHYKKVWSMFGYYPSKIINRYIRMFDGSCNLRIVREFDFNYLERKEREKASCQK